MPVPDPPELRASVVELRGRAGRLDVGGSSEARRAAASAAPVDAWMLAARDWNSSRADAGSAAARHGCPCSSRTRPRRRTCPPRPWPGPAGSRAAACPPSGSSLRPTTAPRDRGAGGMISSVVCSATLNAISGTYAASRPLESTEPRRPPGMANVEADGNSSAASARVTESSSSSTPLPDSKLNCSATASLSSLARPTAGRGSRLPPPPPGGAARPGCPPTCPCGSDSSMMSRTSRSTVRSRAARSCSTSATRSWIPSASTCCHAADGRRQRPGPLVHRVEPLDHRTALLGAGQHDPLRVGLVRELGGDEVHLVGNGSRPAGAASARPRRPGTRPAERSRSPR